MDKTQILAAITALSEQNLVTKDEVLTAYSAGQKTKQSTGILGKDMGVSEVLYFIGGLIVFIGVAIFIGQNWMDLSSIARVLVTLGLGVVCYLSGIILNKEEKYGALGYAFHFIAALIIPLGLGVVFDQAGFDVGSPATLTLISGIVSAVYLASFFLFRKSIFTFFSIAYLTWFFFSLTNFLIAGDPRFTDIKYYEYRALLVGLSYMFFSYYLSFTSQRELSGVLYGVGSLLFLGMALTLGGWKPSQNIFWEVAYPVLIFIILYLSVQLKTKAFLTFGTVFLMAYILKITSEYFSDTIGWPLSLMICGILLIGIGFYSFNLSKKYFSS